jgi:hypothetical protein
VEHEIASLRGKHADIEGHSDCDMLVLDDIKGQCTDFLEKDSSTGTPQDLHM